MVTARTLPSAVPGSLGVGGVNAYAAALRSSAPNPNLALRKYVTSSGTGGDLRFDAAGWLSAVQANASWAEASWADSAKEDGADGEGDGAQPAAGADVISQLQTLLGVSP
jgi:hypothetical protein